MYSYDLFFSIKTKKNKYKNKKCFIKNSLFKLKSYNFINIKNIKKQSFSILGFKCELKTQYINCYLF